MKRNNIIIIIMSILLACTLIGNLRLRVKLETEPAFYESLRVENNLLSEGFFTPYLFENTNVHLEIPVNNAEGEDTFLFNDIDKNTVVVFASYYACPDCFSNSIESANKWAKKAKINVVFGIEGMPFEKFALYVKNKKIQDNAYLLPNGYFDGFSISPVVFFVVENNVPKHYFVPCELLPNLTNDYLNFIKDLVE